MSKPLPYVITGAGSGIGRAIATRLVAEGHEVFGLGRSRAKLEEVARELKGFSFTTADLTSERETTAAVHSIRTWLGSRSLAGLVNNAGVFDRLSFNESTDELWMRHFENNVMSAVRLTRELAPCFSAGSSVLNISSTLGLRPVMFTSAYSAMKAAMVNWSSTLALEWASAGIRVNCLCPGLVDTPIHGFHGEDDKTSEARRQAHAAQPLGRMGTPEEIAASSWFLLSPESSWTTGAVLTVDGGIRL